MKLRGSALCLAAALALSACAARVERENVFSEGRTEIELRHELRGGEVLPKGYSHPAVIAPTRLANLLSSIDIRKGGKDEERQPYIPAETLYTIAKGVSQALAKANPDQQLAVISIRNQKHFGIFDRNFLTSFVCYVMGEQLYLHVSHSEWEIPRDKNARIPWPRIGDSGTPLRVVAGRGISVVDARTIAADWRSDFFARARSIRIDAKGAVVRRTVLMESPEIDAPPAVADEALPADLPPEALRALAELEAQRRRGEITEAYYLSQRGEILSDYAPQ